jgi:hypothetical protein
MEVQTRIQYVQYSLILVQFIITAVTIATRLAYFTNRGADIEKAVALLHGSFLLPLKNWLSEKTYPYLLVHEIFPVVLSSLFLNYLGWVITRSLNSILFFDMTGTALAAFLLGPIWGSFVGITSSMIHWALWPQSDRDIVILPWFLINMSGGWIWGVMARNWSFTKYLDQDTLKSNFSFLFRFGFLSALFMALVGILISYAVKQELFFPVDEAFSKALHQQVDIWKANSVSNFPGHEVLKYLPELLMLWIIYIPDKALSTIVALVLCRYAFPLYSEQLLRSHTRPQLTDGYWSGAWILLMVYLVPLYLLINSSPPDGRAYGEHWFAIVLYAPLAVLATLAIAGQILRKDQPPEVRRDLSRKRSIVYDKMREVMKQQTSFRAASFSFLVSNIVVVLFVIGMAYLMGKEFVDSNKFLELALSFIEAAYGFLIATRLIRIVVAQNYAVDFYKKKLLV